MSFIAIVDVGRMDSPVKGRFFKEKEGTLLLLYIVTACAILIGLQMTSWATCGFCPISAWLLLDRNHNSRCIMLADARIHRLKGNGVNTAFLLVVLGIYNR